MQRILATPPAHAKHPAFFSVASLALITPLCVLGAIIGTQLIVTLGITTNTSLIGALAGMILARIPLAAFLRYRSVHVQNLAQSAISASTFGAGNAMLLPIGIPFLLGRPDLVPAMLAGVFAATLVDGYLLYRVFDSDAFPPGEAWPPGVAAAEAIRAGDEGGRKGAVLIVGLLTGIVGSGWFKIPMSAFGVAFIGNVWALVMFGLGLLARGYQSTLFGAPIFAGILPGADLGKANVPQGMMIGAGLIALVQIIVLMAGRPKAASTAAHSSPAEFRRSLGLGSLAFLAIAIFLAIAGGLVAQLSTGMLIAFVLYAAIAALAHELIVGLAAMHAGWFPAFAVALITLTIGIQIGFPPVALTLLVGFSAATGPAFADMGYDLKAGWMLRGEGADAEFERDGRRQQLYAALFAFVVAGAVVAFAYPSYFAANLVAPVDRAYVAAIKAGSSWDIARALLIWAIPGALLQGLGGPKRQLGVLFSTGLLIGTPLAGWAVLVGIACRVAWTRFAAPARRGDMEVFAAGVIAGDALFSFYDSTARYFARK
jgi:uncharacterized oligopeptide transporter (OPT) family protein